MAVQCHIAGRAAASRSNPVLQVLLNTAVKWQESLLANALLMCTRVKLMAASFTERGLEQRVDGKPFIHLA